MQKKSQEKNENWLIAYLRALEEEPAKLSGQHPECAVGQRGPEHRQTPQQYQHDWYDWYGEEHPRLKRKKRATDLRLQRFNPVLLPPKVSVGTFGTNFSTPKKWPHPLSKPATQGVVSVGGSQVPAPSPQGNFPPRNCHPTVLMGHLSPTSGLANLSPAPAFADLTGDSLLGGQKVVLAPSE